MGKQASASSSSSSWSGFLWGSTLTATTIFLYQNRKNITNLLTELLEEYQQTKEDRQKDAVGGVSSRSVIPNVRKIAASMYNASSSMAQTLNQDEQHGFLTDIMKQLWPYINIAGSDTIRDTAEPMFKDMMPGPLKTMHFTKIDLGTVPIRLDNVVIHEVDLDSNTLQFDVDVIWDGNCDIKLKADYMGSFGVKSIKMRGRMSILMRPLVPTTSVVAGIQYGFINAPEISLKYSGMAHLADFKVIDQTITDIMQSTVSDMMVLPHRSLYKMDPGCDFAKIYKPPIGVARIKVMHGRGFVVEKGLLVNDIPDCYVKIKAGGVEHRTTTIMDDLEPTWDETKDYLLCDHDQILEVQVWDEDDGPLDADDAIGSARTTPGEIILSGKTLELALQQEDRPTGSFLTLGCEVLNFTSDLTSLKSTDESQLCGLLTIMVLRGFDIPLSKQSAATFVKVTCGKSTFTTSAVVDYPGVDCLNPWYDSAFLVDLTPARIKAGKLPSVCLELINGTNTVLGKIVLDHIDIVTAAEHTLRETRPIGNKGAKLEFQVCAQGVEPKVLPPTIITDDDEPVEILSSEVTRDLLNAGATSANLRGSNQVPSALRSVVNSPNRSEDGSYDHLSELENILEDGRASSTEHNFVRVTVVSGKGFKVRKTPWWQPDDSPDVYLNITFGSSPQIWRTRTIHDNLFPVWNENREYVLHSHGQVIDVEVYDEDGSHKKDDDHHYGSVRITVGKVLLNGGVMQQEIVSEGRGTGAYLTIKCQLVKK